MTQDIAAGHETTRLASRAAATGGALGAVTAVGAIVGEVVAGAEFMGSTSAEALGWTSFLAACALVLGVAGLVPVVTTQGQRLAWAALMVGTAATTGATATLALVVPALTDRAPDLASNPPAAVPATFILSSMVMGVSGIALALGLRKVLPALPRPAFLLLVIGSVVAITPLPSRFFLLAFGVAAVLAHVATGAAATRSQGPSTVETASR